MIPSNAASYSFPPKRLLPCHDDYDPCHRHAAAPQDGTASRCSPTASTARSALGCLLLSWFTAAGLQLSWLHAAAPPGQRLRSALHTRKLKARMKRKPSQLQAARAVAAHPPALGSGATAARFAAQQASSRAAWSTLLPWLLTLLFRSRPFNRVASRGCA